jgi:hypothetical protein
MSGVSDMAALLAGLSDDDLLAVVVTATIGKPRLDPLHAVAAELAARGDHVVDAEIVSFDTDGPAGAAGDAPPAEAGPVAPVSGMPVPPAGIAGYTAGGVPTFESVRDKVEQRFGTAQGMSELTTQTPAGRSVEEQWEAREKAARERLEQIRKSVRGSDSG